MAPWSITIIYFSFHSLCLIIGYLLGTKSLKQSSKTDNVSNSINYHRNDIDDKEEEKYNCENISLSEQILEKQRNENNIDDELLDTKYALNAEDEFNSTQTWISWPLLVCILYNLSMSFTIGILYEWAHFILKNESRMIIISIQYISIIIYILFRICSSFVIYNYTKFFHRFIFNLFFDYDVIFAFYISCKVNKLYNKAIIIPLSHIHVFMSCVLSFWLVLFVTIYMVLTVEMQFFYFVCIIFNYISMLTAFTMDDTNRLTHGTSLEFIRVQQTKKRMCCNFKVSMSPFYIFRISFRHIDILFRLFVFYAIILSMGMVTFGCFLLFDFVYVVLNGCVWSYYHYFLDVYQSLIVSSFSLISNCSNESTQFLRYRAAANICFQRVLSHFVMIIFITCWCFVDFECSTCPKYEQRIKNIHVSVYALLWVLLVLYALLWQYPMHVLDRNVSLKMPKICPGNVDLLKDFLFYGIRIHAMHLYLFETKEFNEECIDLMMEYVSCKDKDKWGDNMLHNLCQNEKASLSVINTLHIKYKLPWNEMNKQKLCPIQYYFEYNKNVQTEIIDLAAKNGFTSMIDQKSKDNLLHKICKNSSVRSEIILHVLDQNEFIKLCFDKNVLNETPFHCYLKRCKHLAKAVINKFVVIYKEQIDNLDYFGNTYMHSICQNPMLNERILEHILSLIALRLVMQKNHLNLKAIQYIESNHCYPSKLLQLIENAMNTAKNNKSEINEEEEEESEMKLERNDLIHHNNDSRSGLIEDTFSIPTNQESKKKSEVVPLKYSKDDQISTNNHLSTLTPFDGLDNNDLSKSDQSDDSPYFDLPKDKNVSIMPPEPEEKKNETKKEKQQRLLKQKWYFDARRVKPFGSDEVSFNFIECVDCVFNKFGQLSWFQIRGIIVFKSELSEHCMVHLLTNDLRNWRYSNMSAKKLISSKMRYMNLEHTSFAPCVNINGWTKRRQIYFMPPNGIQFVLLSYRISQKYLDSNIVPFRCYTSIKYQGNKKNVLLRITFRNNSHCEQRYIVKLNIPYIAGKKKDVCNVVLNHGIYKINDDDIVWSIFDVAQYEAMTFEYHIRNIEDESVLNGWLLPRAGAKPAINVEFKFIADCLFSKFNVEKCTVLDENNQLKDVRIWNRKQSMNGQCVIELG